MITTTHSHCVYKNIRDDVVAIYKHTFLQSPTNPTAPITRLVLTTGYVFTDDVLTDAFDVVSNEVLTKIYNGDVIDTY